MAKMTLKTAKMSRYLQWWTYSHSRMALLTLSIYNQTRQIVLIAESSLLPTTTETHSQRLWAPQIIDQSNLPPSRSRSLRAQLRYRNRLALSRSNSRQLVTREQKWRSKTAEHSLPSCLSKMTPKCLRLAPPSKRRILKSRRRLIRLCLTQSW